METKVSSAPHKMPATLRLTSEDLAAIKGWKVGSTYTIMMTVKQTASSMGSDEYGPYDGEHAKKDLMNARFEVISAREASGGSKKYIKKVSEY